MPTFHHGVAIAGEKGNMSKSVLFAIIAHILTLCKGTNVVGG
jgi:hypothetical protein